MQDRSMLPRRFFASSRGCSVVLHKEDRVRGALVLKKGLLGMAWGQSAGISYCAERRDLTAYPRPYLVAISSSSVVSGRPSTCREPGLIVFVAVNSIMYRLESDTFRRVNMIVIMVRSRNLRTRMCRQWQMSIC